MTTVNRCATCGGPVREISTIPCETLVVCDDPRCGWTERICRPYVQLIAAENELTKLKAENEKLKAIVDKLPKFKDGVPACIGDDAWLVIDGSMRKGIVRPIQNLYENETKVRVGFYDHEDAEYDTERRGEECYSTRDAAEAAKEKK